MSASFDPYAWKTFHFDGINREEASRMLSLPDVQVGTFLLRDSSRPGDYSLSVRESNDDNKVRHYLIEKSEGEGGGTYVKIADQQFPDIPMLLNHFKMRVLDRASLSMPFRKQHIDKVVGVFRFEGERESDLPFEAGEHLEIISKKDPDWWQARNALNNTGLVPANYVAAVDESEESARRASRGSYSSGSGNGNERFSGVSTHSGGGGEGDERNEPASLPAWARAVLDRQPNAYDQNALRLRKGDLVHVTRRMPNGLFEGVLEGRTGVFPPAYIKFDKVVDGVAA